MEVKVSVIIPNYNTNLKYLKKAIKSIQNQTYKNIEIIIVDDGSSNGSYEYLKKIQKKDSRIILFKNKKNCGIVDSLNRGISIASGKYVVRMDSDDISSNKRIKKSVCFMESHPDIDILGTQVLKFGKCMLRKTNLPTKNDELYARMLFGTPFIHPTITFKSDFIKSISYSKEELAEDYYLWFRSMILKARMANLNYCGLYYRMHKGQVTSQKKIKLLESEKSIFKKILSYAEIMLTNEDFNLLFNILHFYGYHSFNDFKRVIEILCEIKNKYCVFYAINIDDYNNVFAKKIIRELIKNINHKKMDKWKVIINSICKLFSYKLSITDKVLLLLASYNGYLR